jgi:sugar (pentulose or hexulose) kinase
MSAVRHVAVIDIGKSNAKVALVDLSTLEEVSVRKTANHIRKDGPYPHLDVEGLWSFILEGLAALARDKTVDAISVTTHGATVTLLDRAGQLALPVLDYESDCPAETASEYDALRPAFSETGSPRLPLGLNLGAQLFWLQSRFPQQFANIASILMYPQYWSYRLTGIASNEVTSLGCHTDLWSPGAGDYSSLVKAHGWHRLMAPLRKAADILGPVLPEVANKAGLRPGTPVICGIHDSNASLLPHLMAQQPPFSVVSTGTWVISMAIGGSMAKLDPARDSLVNVNAFGVAVPSARFMGGREYQMITGGTDALPSQDDVSAVLDKGLFLLPSVVKGSGPYPSHKSQWYGAVAATPARRQAAASFYLAMMTAYLAMMTAACLDLIGADGDIVVEGPFAASALYAEMLATATRRSVRMELLSATGTAAGAALLAMPDFQPREFSSRCAIGPAPRMSQYADRWQTLVASSCERAGLRVD